MVVRLLLSTGADVVAEDDRGETAMHKACRNCHFQVVQVMSDVQLTQENSSAFLSFLRSSLALSPRL